MSERTQRVDVMGKGMKRTNTILLTALLTVTAFIFFGVFTPRSVYADPDRAIKTNNLKTCAATGCHDVNYTGNLTATWRNVTAAGPVTAIANGGTISGLTAGDVVEFDWLSSGGLNGKAIGPFWEVPAGWTVANSAAHANAVLPFWHTSYSPITTHGPWNGAGQTLNAGYDGYIHIFTGTPYASAKNAAMDDGTEGVGSDQTANRHGASIQVTVPSGGGTIYLGMGGHQVSARGYDVLSVNLSTGAGDVTAPTVDTFTITNASHNSTTVPIASFTASDAVGVTGYMITESATAPLAGDASWLGAAPATYTVSGGDGSYTLYAWAKDAAGNVSTSLSDTVVVDTTAPSSTISAPTAGAFLAAADFPYTISGTATDGTGTGLALVEVDINAAGTWPDATGTATWTYSWAQPADGSYTIQSRATDSTLPAANVETPGAGVTVTVDATAPTLTSTNPANGAIDVPLDQNVTITFNEANLDCTTVNTTNITSAMPSWTFSSCNDATGVAVFTTTGQLNSTAYSFTITSNVADKAGNTYAGPTTISYTTVAVGNTAPNVPVNPAQYESDGLTAIAVGGFSSTTTLVFEGDLSDPDGDTVKLQIDYTGDNVSDCESALVASGTANVQVTCAGLVDGTGYDWQYQAVDSNAAVSGWTAFNGASPDFTVDATAPTLTSTDPANGATGVTVDQNVTITFNEANLNCTTVNTTNITSAMPGWAFSSCNDATGVAVFTTTGQTDSTTYDFTITSSVADKAGNTYAGPTTISYTTAGPVCTNADPTVTITSADSQITAGSGNVVYNVDVTNNDSAGCGDTTFTLSASDTNGFDFTASALGTTSLLVSPGATQSTTLTVTAVASPTNGNTNDTTVTSAAAGPHGAVTSNAVTTLINIAGTPTMYYNVGETVHIEYRSATRFTNQGTAAVSVWDSSAGAIFVDANMTEVQDGATWIYTYDWDTTAQAADSYRVKVSDSDTSPSANVKVVLDNATAKINLFSDANYLNQTDIFAHSDTVYVEVLLPGPETATSVTDLVNFYDAPAFVPTINGFTANGNTVRFNFVIDFVAASIPDGDWGYYYWAGLDTGIDFHTPIKRSDSGCGTCTPGVPTLSIVTTDQTITTDGGSANYTINLTNTDSTACGSTAFDLVAVDSNLTEFSATGSTFATDPLTVAPGATGSTTMTVTAQGGFYSGTNTSSFTIVDDTIHGTPSSGNVITTLAVPDITPPAVAISDPTNGSYLNAASANPYTISGTASDDRSVSLVEVSIDGGAYVSATGTGPWTYSWTLPADGSHTIDARATDGTNTTNATQVTVTVDTVAPVTSDNILAPWSSTDRSNVTLSVVEATSGVASTVYCVDTANSCAPGTAYGGPFTITQLAGQENVQYLRYFSTDNAGNAETPAVSTAVNIDKKSPVDGVSLTATPGDNTVSLSWDPATDGGSGLDTTAAYRIWRQVGPTAPACGGGTEIGTGFTATSHVDSTAVNGTEYSYRVCAYDLVGNPPSTGLTATATPAAACSRFTPSVSLSANQDITSDGGFVDYTITVTNNDTGGCAAQTFDVKEVTNLGAGFTVTYPNGTTSGSIAVGGNDASLVARVTANGGTLNGATHTVGVSTDQSTDANHNTDSAEAQATTTMNVTCTAPTVSIDTANQTITVDGGTAAYTVSVDWSGGPVACGTRSFDLVPADTNGTDFAASTFTADPLSVTPGAVAATTTLIVDSNANIPDLSTNDTYFYAALNSDVTLGDVPQSGNSPETVTTTVDRTCVRNAPDFGYGANRTIDAAGSAVYTLTVINNDVDCLDTTFDITLGTETDTGAPSFTTPSTLSTLTITVAGDNDGAGPGTGGSDTLTLTVVGNGAGSAGDTLTSDVTLSDATNHGGQDQLIQPVTTIQPNNPLIHNSISTESTKWGGSWGVSGGKYGKFECATCHSPVEADLNNGTDFNIKRVKATIATPDGSNWASTGTPTVSVRFTDANPSPTGIGFGDDSDGHTTSTRVCEACHTQNKYHNYDTTLNTLNTHENNNDCTTCHKHNEGFKGGGNCATCHDYPPDPAGGNAELATEGEGAHPKHVSHLVTLLGTGALDPDVDAYGDAKTIAVCGACHDMSAAQHETSGGTRSIDFSGDPGTVVDDNQYRFAPSGSPTYNGVQGTPSATTPKSCSNVSCHYQETPIWQ